MKKFEKLSKEINEYDLGDGYKLQRENILEMASLIVEAENNNPALNTSSVKETEGWITNYYFAENQHTEWIHKASTAVYDKKTKKLFGVCLVSLWQEWPLIGEISVKPGYENRGLGTNMIKKALAVLKDEFPVLRLYVTIENLYYNLVFFKARELVDMKLER